MFFSEQKKQETQTMLQNQQQNAHDRKEDEKINPAELLENALANAQGSQPKEEKSKFGFPQNNNYNVADYRSLVKTLVCGVKTITWGCSACKVTIFKNLLLYKILISVNSRLYLHRVNWCNRNISSRMKPWCSYG